MSQANSLLLATFLLPIFALPADGSKGWLLEQTIDAEPIAVTVTDRAVKACVGRRHWSVVARYPDWKVTMFNSSSKLRYDMLFSSWKTCSVLHNYYGQTYMDSRKSQDGLPRLKVLSRREYSASREARVKIVFDALGEKIGGRDWYGISTTAEDAPRTRVHEVRSYTCTYAPSLSNEPVRRFLLSLTATPEGPGVPLEYIVNLQDGRKYPRLLTRSKRRVNTSVKDFAIPGDLVYAKTFFETLVPENRQQVEKMFQDLDLGRPFGSDAGKTDRRSGSK